MIQSILIGALLGLVAGAIPGPFTALIAATALEGGFWAGLAVGLVPIMTESLMLGLTAATLSQMPDSLLRWMGVAGGLFVFYLAWRAWPSESSASDDDPQPTGRLVARAATLGLLSPTGWLFWLFVGGPLFLDAWYDGRTHAFAYFGAFLACLIGVHAIVAATAGWGRDALTDVWRRRLTMATSVVLFLAGAALVWQAWTGNFGDAVVGPEEIEEVVGDSLGG